MVEVCELIHPTLHRSMWLLIHAEIIVDPAIPDLKSTSFYQSLSIMYPSTPSIHDSLSYIHPLPLVYHPFNVTCICGHLFSFGIFYSSTKPGY